MSLYRIEIFHGTEEDNVGLGQFWEIDTKDPDWRDGVPDRAALVALVEDDEHSGEAPSLGHVAELLARLGYAEASSVVHQAAEDAEAWMQAEKGRLAGQPSAPPARRRGG